MEASHGCSVCTIPSQKGKGGKEVCMGARRGEGRKEKERKGKGGNLKFYPTTWMPKAAIKKLYPACFTA